MKFIPAAEGQVLHRLELTRRNLEVLLAKLDDPLSQRQILDDVPVGIVAAVEDHQCLEVIPVENEAHYHDREPGPMYICRAPGSCYEH